MINKLLLAGGFGVIVLGSSAGVSQAGVVPAEPLPPLTYEVVGTVTDYGPINLPFGSAWRIGEQDRADLTERLSIHGDSTRAVAVTDIVDQAFPSGIPTETVLVIGIADSSCFPPTSVGLEYRMGTGNVEVVLTAVDDPREGTVLCAVGSTTIAVIAADAELVPPGSTDGADLVAFQQVGGSADVTVLELDGVDDTEALLRMIGPPDGVPTLPELPTGSRRFAFLVSGCRATTAELIVTATTVEAHAVATELVSCVGAESYLAVFDSAIVPANAELVAPPRPQR